MGCDRCFTYLDGQLPVLLFCSLAWRGLCQRPVADCAVNGDVQISSADYVYEDGKKVHSTRLPGYSGAAGLDGEPEPENEDEGLDSERGITDSAGNGRDLESVCVSQLFVAVNAMDTWVSVASACAVAMAVVPVGQIQSNGCVISGLDPKQSAPSTSCTQLEFVLKLYKTIRVSNFRGHCQTDMCVMSCLLC